MTWVLYDAAEAPVMTNLCPTCGAYWDCEHTFRPDPMPPQRPDTLAPTVGLDFGFRSDLTLSQVIDDLLGDVSWANDLKSANPSCRSWLGGLL